MNLPASFTEYTRALLGVEEYEKLVSALQQEPPVTNVTDGADVNVGLFALVTFLSHWEIPSNLFVSYPAARRNPLGRRRENPVSKGDRRKITSSRVRR